MTTDSEKHLTLPFFILVFLCAIAAFEPALHARFLNWDDTFLVLGNPSVRSISLSAVADWFSSFHVNHYHPVVLFTFAAEHTVFGPDPLPFHATNIILHGLNTLLVLVLLSRFVKDRVALTLAVLLFALHPLRAEVVAWVSARKDLLSTGFILLSLLGFLRYADHHRRRDLLLSFVAAMLASLSKAIAVVIPFLMLALLLPMPVAKRRPLVRSLIPFAALSALTGVIAVLAQYSTGRVPYDPSTSLLRSMSLPFGNILFYAWKTVYPGDLSAVYPYPENGGPELLGLSLLAILVAFVGMVLLIRARPGPIVLLSISWIVVTLLPVLQIIPAGRAFAADRFTYLPAIGLSLLVGFLLDAAVRRKEGLYRPVIRRAGILVLAALGTVSYIRTEVWETSATVWTDVLTQYPAYAEGYVYLGSALATEERDLEGAIEAFGEAIRLDDRIPGAYNNRALASFRSAAPDTTQILSDLERAVALDPGNQEFLSLLAEAYDRFGRFTASFGISTKLLDRDPSLHRIRLLRIRTALALGDRESVQVDIAYLKQAGIEVSIEQSGREAEEDQR